MNYHDVMETYKHPPSIKYIPRIFSWLLVFVLLFGVSKTAYAYDAEPVIWVQVPQWTDDWAVCAVDNAETKLTTVKIIKGVYSNFKRVSFDSDVTLQKLVNRTVERYVSDEEFRKEMNEYLKLQVSGSQF